MENIFRRGILVLAALAVFVVPIAVSAAGGFTDVADDNIFKNDIQWMADNGITKGCNPPTNDKFCPSDVVTRQTMAAFMHRLAVNKVVDAKTATTAGHATTAGDADTVDGQQASEFLQLDSVLQPGETITGTWGAAGHTSGYAFQGIDFRPNINPAGPITGEYVIKNAYTANCPGDNQAAAGYLCVYHVFGTSGMSFGGFSDPYSDSGGIRDIGTVLWWNVSGSKDFARGNWALTAPLIFTGASSAPPSGPPSP